VTARPLGRAAADRAGSDPAALLPTPTPAADRVTAREIAALLHDLARTRSPALGGDPADRAALLARKAELLARITDQHTLPPTPEGPTP
jgi:hypothetical protein